MARTLGCVKGSWLSSHVQLVVGFAVSGLTHVAGDAMVHTKWAGGSFWFFSAQAFAITFEDLIIARGKQLGLRDTLWPRLVGYVWTFAWFVYITPWWLDWLVKMGLGRDKVIPFSVVSPILDYLNVSSGLDVKAWLAAQFTLRPPV